MRGFLAKLLKNHRNQSVDGALALAACVEKLTDKLWLNVRPEFLHLYADGIRPSPAWRSVLGG